jgi:hypothetical protein
MLIYEIVKTNRTLIKILNIQTKFTKEYVNLLSILDTLKYINFAPANIAVVYVTTVKIALDKFEEIINKFINNQNLDFDNDLDLNKRANLAKQQLEHIKQLRQQIGI